jgi:hypothetical protein
VVHDIEQTRDRAAKLDIRAGVDDTFRDDGRGRVFGLEEKKTGCSCGRGVDDIFRATWIEYNLVGAVFRASIAAKRVCRDNYFVAGDLGDHRAVQNDIKERGLFVVAVLVVGNFRGVLEFFNIHAKLN